MSGIPDDVRFLLVGNAFRNRAIVFAAFLSFSTLARAELSFRHVVVDPNPPVGSGCCLDICAVGDIDGDGSADIMVGSEHSIGAVWYHYPSWKRYIIGEGSFTTDGEIIDLDRDGDGDVVISCISRDVIEWWENMGKPFEKDGWARHEIGPRFAHDLAVEDLNGDKRIDVIMFRKDGPRQLTWFEAPGDPRRKWTRHPIDTPPGEGLDTGDIDGDGDRDIVAGPNWYENAKGDGSQWTRHAVAFSWGDDCRDIIADMNGDKKADIVLSHSEGGGGVSWFENPKWTEHKIESERLVGAHSLEVTDLDGDGDPDVLTGEMHTGGKRVLVYENLGGGASWKRTILGKGGTHNARVGDIGGDGDVDIVGKNYDGSKVVELWENRTKIETSR